MAEPRPGTEARSLNVEASTATYVGPASCDRIRPHSIAARAKSRGPCVPTNVVAGWPDACLVLGMRTRWLLSCFALAANPGVVVVGLLSGCSDTSETAGAPDAGMDDAASAEDGDLGSGDAGRARDAAKEASSHTSPDDESGACACGTGDRCCPPEAPSVCVSGTDDTMCGSESALCAACGPKEGCRATDGGLRCVSVAGGGSPCKKSLDCKSRVCLNGMCSGDGSCLAGGAPCGAGHVGSCCPGLQCAGNCCAPAGTTVPMGSGTMCCPGLTMKTMPGSSDFTCGTP